MSINLEPVPDSALVESNGYGSRPLIRWMNAVRAAFASVPAATTADPWASYAIQMRHSPMASAGGATSTLGFNPPAWTANVAPAAGSKLGYLGYSRRDSAAGAGSGQGVAFTSAAVFGFGDGTGRGGFRIEYVFPIINKVATQRLAYGLRDNSAAAALAAVEPSTLTNCIFLGCDTTDANMQIMHNDAAGTCTKVDLGANYPVTANAEYKLVLTAASNGATVDYTVDRLDTTVAQAAGTLSTNLPANTVLMFLMALCGNGATAAVTSVCCVNAIAGIQTNV